jgi:hypothetical protein
MYNEFMLTHSGHSGFGSSAVLRGSGGGSVVDGFGAGNGNGKPLTITELDAGEDEMTKDRRSDRGNSYVYAGDTDPDNTSSRGSTGQQQRRPDSHYYSFKPAIAVNHQSTNTVDYMTSVGVQARFRPSLTKTVP